MFSTKINLLFSPSEKAKLLAEIFFENSNFDGSGVSGFQNIGHSNIAKSCSRVSRLSIISRIFEKLITVDHLKNCGLSLDF